MKKIFLTQTLVLLTSFVFLVSTNTIANSHPTTTNPNNPNSAITYTFNKENTTKLTNEDITSTKPIEPTQNQDTEHLNPINTKETFTLDPKTVGALFIKYAENSTFFTCTASSIDSPNKNLVITTAHCVVHEDENGNQIFPETIIYAPGYFYDKNAGYTKSPHGQWVAKKVHVSQHFTPKENKMHLFDHAIIELKPNKNGEELINIFGGNKLGIGYSMNQYNVQVFGYPNTYEESKNYDLKQFVGNAEPISSNEMRIEGSLGKGSSGGPWITENGIIFATTSKGNVHYNVSTPHHAFVRELFDQANDNKENSFFEINNKPIKDNNTVTITNLEDLNSIQFKNNYLVYNYVNFSLKNKSNNTATYIPANTDKRNGFASLQIPQNLETGTYTLTATPKGDETKTTTIQLKYETPNN